MKTIDDINLNQWFMERELDYIPSHFVKTTAPITDESKIWILERLRGRFSLSVRSHISFPVFEDPKEAMFYELKWG